MENEQSLLVQVAEGNEQAFGTLYRYYYNRLFQFARLFLESEDASEDVVEDVFFMVWKERSMLVNIPNFHAFVYQSVRNACLNTLKSGYVSKREELSGAECEARFSADTPLDELMRKELCQLLNETINGLPDRCRIVFRMAKEDGMSHREIADILNIQVCTVERQLLLAKSKIKQILGPLFKKK